MKHLKFKTLLFLLILSSAMTITSCYVEDNDPDDVKVTLQVLASGTITNGKITYNDIDGLPITEVLTNGEWTKVLQVRTGFQVKLQTTGTVTNGMVMSEMKFRQTGRGGLIDDEKQCSNDICEFDLLIEETLKR